LQGRRPGCQSQHVTDICQQRWDFIPAYISLAMVRLSILYPNTPAARSPDAIREFVRSDSGLHPGYVCYTDAQSVNQFSEPLPFA
jgi:hypothetical protein